MKKKIKQFTTAVLAVLMAFSATTCSDDPPEDSGENPYIGEILTVTDAQVWEHDGSEHVLSKMYFESSANGDIFLFNSPQSEFLGTGRITEGKLSFTLEEPEHKYEITSNAFKTIINDWWNNVAIIEGSSSIKGNAVTGISFHKDGGEPYVMDGLLLKERLVGTGNSLALEYIIFIYVDGNCRIKGDAKQGMVPDTGYFATQDLDLFLNEGWNMVTRTMRSYTDQLAVDMPIEVKNLVNFKWALWEAPSAP